MSDMPNEDEIEEALIHTARESMAGVPLETVREAIRVAFKAGWIARDLRNTGPNIWTNATGRDAELLDVEEMMTIDHDDFIAEVRAAGDPMAGTLSAQAQRARSMRRHPATPKDRS